MGVYPFGAPLKYSILGITGVPLFWEIPRCGKRPRVDAEDAARAAGPLNPRPCEPTAQVSERATSRIAEGPLKFWITFGWVSGGRPQLPNSHLSQRICHRDRGGGRGGSGLLVPDAGVIVSVLVYSAMLQLLYLQRLLFLWTDCMQATSYTLSSCLDANGKELGTPLPPEVASVGPKLQWECESKSRRPCI